MRVNDPETQELLKRLGIKPAPPDSPLYQIGPTVIFGNPAVEEADQTIELEPSATDQESD